MGCQRALYTYFSVVFSGTTYHGTRLVWIKLYPNRPHLYYPRKEKELRESVGTLLLDPGCHFISVLNNPRVHCMFLEPASKPIAEARFETTDFLPIASLCAFSYSSSRMLIMIPSLYSLS